MATAKTAYSFLLMATYFLYLFIYYKLLTLNFMHFFTEL